MNKRSLLSNRKYMKYLILLSLCWAFEFSYATPNPDCFLTEANAGNLVTGVRSCAVSITSSNLTLNSANGDPRQLRTLHEDNSTAVEFQQLSEAAARVYYSDEPNHCGPGTRNQLPCRDLGRLAMLHTSGQFENAHPCTGANCRTFVETISKWLNSHHDRGGTNCNSTNGVLTRHYCTAITNAFLSKPECSNGSTEAACQTELQTRFQENEEDCSWTNFRDSGMGASIGTCGIPSGRDDTRVASTDPPLSPEPTPVSGPGGDGDASGGSDTSDEDTEQITQLIKDTGNNFLGDGFAMDATSPSGALNVPSTVAQGPDGTNLGNVHAADVGGFNPGSNSAPSAATRLFGQTQGVPGGTPKNSGPQNSARGGGAPGGAMGAGNLGRGGGGNAGGRKSRRRGGRRGGAKTVADDMGKFTNAQGNLANTSGRPTTEKNQSAMDKRIQQQIARNELNGGPDREAINRAFQDKLKRGQGIDRDLMIKASFFPDHSEVYLHLNETSDTLNEQGI